MIVVCNLDEFLSIDFNDKECVRRFREEYKRKYYENKSKKKEEAYETHKCETTKEI